MSNSDIVENPDVQTFLQQCEYLREPSPEEVERFSQRFQPLPDLNSVDLPHHIFAIDGSSYEALIDDRMPSTKAGYVKVSTIHILMEEFGALRVEDGRFVDPFRVAKLRKNKDSLLFVLPGTNMRWQGLTSVRDSFRARVDQVLLQKETRFKKDNYRLDISLDVWIELSYYAVSSRYPDDFTEYTLPLAQDLWSKVLRVNQAARNQLVGPNWTRNGDLIIGLYDFDPVS